MQFFFWILWIRQVTLLKAFPSRWGKCVLHFHLFFRPSSSSNKNRGQNYDKNLEEYLTQFGYLAPSSAHSLRSIDVMINAVKNLQFYAGLNITGHIDDATVDLITK